MRNQWNKQRLSSEIEKTVCSNNRAINHSVTKMSAIEGATSQQQRKSITSGKYVL
jgi:hypothetical protein